MDGELQARHDVSCCNANPTISAQNIATRNKLETKDTGPDSIPWSFRTTAKDVVNSGCFDALTVTLRTYTCT